MDRMKYLWIAVAMLTTVSLCGLSQISFDSDPTELIPAGNRDAEFLREVLQQFDADQQEFIFIAESQDLFSTEGIKSLRELVAEVSSMPGVSRVNSLVDSRFFIMENLLPRPLLPEADAPESSYVRAREDALSHPLIRGVMLSEDARATLLSVRFQQDRVSLSETMQIADRLREIAGKHERSGRLRIRLTGHPVVEAESIRLVESETLRLSVIAAFLSVMLALCIFRRWDLTIIVCAAPLVGVVWTLGTLGLVGEKLNAMTTVLPVLVLTIGFTDAVHLVFHLRRSRSNGLSPREASCVAVRQLTFPCMLTSLTTGIGFSSLVLTQNDVIRRFGLSCALGTGFAFLAAISIVPLLGTLILSRRYETPRPEPPLRFADKFFHCVVRYRWPIMLGSLVLTVFLSATACQLRPAVELTELLPDRSDTKMAITHLDEHFGGCHSGLIVVDGPARNEVFSKQFQQALEAAEQVCWHNPHTNYPVSILTVARTIPGGEPRLLPSEVTRRLVRSDLRRAIIQFRFRDRSRGFQQNTFEELRQELRDVQQQFPGYRFRLTGDHLVTSAALRGVISDLAVSLAGAAVAVFGALSLAFRSIRLGCLCVIPNVLPMLLAASLLVWMDEPLRISSVVVFSIFLGIAVDDTIHSLTEFVRQLRTEGQVNPAVCISFPAVTRPIVTTTAVLVLAFGSVGFGQLPHNQVFACLGVTAMAAALLGDLIVLPALLACCVPDRFGSTNDLEPDQFSESQAD